MHLRSGDHGYGLVAKTLHWLTVVLVAAQFYVGLTMSSDDAEGAAAAEDRLERLELAEDRFRDRLDEQEEAAEARGEAAEEAWDAEEDRLRDAFEAEQEAEEERLDARLDDDEYVDDAFTEVVELRFAGNGISEPEWHVLLGLSLIALGLVRILWRWTTPLPPWAEHLSERERGFEGAVEKLLLAMLVVTPATGLLLVAGNDDLLPLHIAAQILFVAAIVGHVGLVLKHTVVHRNRHLARMT